MAHFYLDSSALVKRYIAEAGTPWMQTLCAPSADHVLYTVRITGAEIIAALFRRARAGALSITDVQTAAGQFRFDFHGDYQIVEVTEALIDRAMALAEKHGLRGYDSVQLAAALELQALRASFALPPITFVSADDLLNGSALAEGLAVENPSLQP
jgi:hypothetical protein